MQPRWDEMAFLAALRALPLHPAARGLADDAAVLGERVVTLDTLVEGVHFLPDDPPADVAWKLVATNYSDLAAKGAVPEGVLLSYPLSPSSLEEELGWSSPALSTTQRPPPPAPPLKRRGEAWDRAFLSGLSEALFTFGGAILGGDTVALPAGAPRVLSLTALGTAAKAPSRGGARAGDALWVTGTIGDGGAGLAIAHGRPGPLALLQRYRRPTPRLAEGAALAPLVTAMMDVSDGLLLDAARLAAASGLAAAIDLAAVPRSPALLAHGDPGTDGVLAAATAGDDYELLFALHPAVLPPIAATRIGTLSAGAGLSLTLGGAAVPLPATLGFTHDGAALALPGDAL